MSERREAFAAIRADEALKEKTRQRAAGAGVSEQDRRTSRRSWQVAVAAVLALALLGGGFRYHVITAEAAYVSMETAGAEDEPGLGLSVNRWGNVIAAESFNEDGQSVLARVEVVGLSYEEALQAVLQAAEDLGYLTEDMQIDFAVCARAENALVQEVQDTCQAVVEQVCPYTGGGCGWVSQDVRKMAGGYGMSCNRYQLAQAIQELDESVSMEDCSQYTLHQLYCWYQALCAGETVTVEEVPEICTQYGCGIRGQVGWGNGNQGNGGQGNGNQGNGGQGGHHGNRHRAW